MSTIAGRLRRAVVHRHTEAARSFWLDVARALDDLGLEDVDVRVVILFREAAAGPASLDAWLDAVGARAGADPIADALDRLERPRTAPAASVRRAREVVLRATR